MKIQLKTIIILSVIALLYSCGGNEEKKIDGNAERDALEKSLTLSLEANKLTQSPNDEMTFDLPETTEKEIVAKLEQSVKIGSKINDKFLEWLHEGLQNEFKDHFVRGNALYLEGLKTDNVQKQIEGNKLIMQWNGYWNNNSKAILGKMYPEEN